MENLLASARLYLMVLVFFSSCFLGLMYGVSLPMLAIRSVVIVSIVGVLSHLFIKYIVSVAKTVQSEEPDQTHCPGLHDVDHAIDQSNK
ncbi:MAG: hypothetical protein NG747_03770 [Candidatus Brocadia sp.]|nr:hypothetical protein [Candidatus Brocadia sp.]NUO07151.1 hypothetical protein [Candidatus Brocadia sp.]